MRHAARVNAGTANAARGGAVDGLAGSKCVRKASTLLIKLLLYTSNDYHKSIIRAARCDQATPKKPAMTKSVPLAIRAAF